MTDTLKNGGLLHESRSLTSANGRFHFIVQNDGNLVVYDTHLKHANGTSVARRESGAHGKFGPYYLELQPDNDLVLYSEYRKSTANPTVKDPRWRSDTRGKGEKGTAYATMQDDGNLVIRDKNGDELWNSDSKLRVPIDIRQIIDEARSSGGPWMIIGANILTSIAIGYFSKKFG